jgi:hypothetical protein
MPRRSPSRVRAEICRRRGNSWQIPGASTALRMAIGRLETRHLRPGEVAGTFRVWQSAVRHAPPRHGGRDGLVLQRFQWRCCQWCTPDDMVATPREVLATAISLLPPRAAHELRRLVTALDTELFTRARHDASIRTDEPW